MNASGGSRRRCSSCMANMDRIVPIRFGERLFTLANEPKQMVRFPSGGHVDLDDHGAPDAVRAFLNGLPRTLN